MSAVKRTGPEGRLKSIRVIHGNRSGFTLIELLISVAILSIIMIGLSQVLGTALSSYENTKGKQDLIREARYTMERMVMFVQESDEVTMPNSMTAHEVLEVSERVLDAYDNATNTFLIGGDGILDSDNDANGIVNEGSPDGAEYITFQLDKTEAGNWKLTEERPRYNTPGISDKENPEVICEGIKVFNTSLVADNLIEIELTLSDGRNEVTLKTRARARLLN